MKPLARCCKSFTKSINYMIKSSDLWSWKAIYKYLIDWLKRVTVEMFCPHAADGKFSFINVFICEKCRIMKSRERWERGGAICMKTPRNELAPKRVRMQSTLRPVSNLVWESKKNELTAGLNHRGPKTQWCVNN